MIVLGINAYHGDASACLVRDGRIIAAAEEERFRRIKHWAGFPSQAIAYCLAEAGAGLEDVAHVAVNSNPRASAFKKAMYALKRRPDPALILDRIRNQSKRLAIETELAQATPGQRFSGRVHRVEHHVAHLASCFLVSPFEEATAVSVDGFGDFSSAAWGIGRGSHIDVEGRVYFPHSLGVFYQALTQYWAFPHYGDEYKVMGSGALRRAPIPATAARDRALARWWLLSSWTSAISGITARRSPTNGRAEARRRRLCSRRAWRICSARRGRRASRWRTSHRDIARSVQAMYEEAFFHLLDALHARHRLDSLTLAGGCAMNSVANGKVRRAFAIQAALRAIGGRRRGRRHRRGRPCVACRCPGRRGGPLPSTERARR